MDALRGPALPQNLTSMGGIQCRTTIRLLSRNIDNSVNSTVYWIVKETLNNVIQHSGANIVQVDVVERSLGWLCLAAMTGVWD